MLSRRSVMWMAALAACVLTAGCGEEGAGGDASRVAKAALLSVDDLPPGARVASGTVSNLLCLPARVFRAGDAIAIKGTPVFRLPPNSVLDQAVAVFSSEQAARSALDALTAQENIACTRAALQHATVENIGSEAPIKQFVDETPIAGRTARRVGFLVNFPVSRDGVRVWLTYVRVGRAVAALSFISFDGPLSKQAMSKAVVATSAVLADELGV